MTDQLEDILGQLQLESDTHDDSAAANNNTPNNNHDPSLPFDDYNLEPKPIEELERDDPIAIFTDEDIFAALLHIDGSSFGATEVGDIADFDRTTNDEDYTATNNSLESFLPDILTEDLDVSDLLAPENLDSVFDDDGDDNQFVFGSPDKTLGLRESYQTGHTSTETGSGKDTSVAADTAVVTSPADNDISRDQAAGDLLQELEKLSLDPLGPSHHNETGLPAPITGDTEEGVPFDGKDDFLPAYLFCQLCSDQDEGVDPFDPKLPLILSAEDVAAALAELDPTLSFDQREDPAEQLIQLADLNLDDEDPHFLDGMERHGALVEPGPPTVMVRKRALIAAEPILDAFSNTERSCIGHKEKTFGVTFSDCGKLCATSSQDSTVKVWDVETNALLATLDDHSKAYECLRVAWASSQWGKSTIDRSNHFKHLLATGGADGTVKIWGCQDPKAKQEWKCYKTIDHGELLAGVNKPQQDVSPAKEDTQKEDEATKGKDDKPQVYTLQFIDHWKAFTKSDNDVTTAENAFLMTSSDDYIHFWEIMEEPMIKEIPLDQDLDTALHDVSISLKEVMSLHFTGMQNYGSGVRVCSLTSDGLDIRNPSQNKLKLTEPDNTPFGGDRNPENTIFVFDAAYCPANSLLGVALSDGSMRLVNGRGVCVSILSLPGCQSHLTSFCWDSSGERVATSVATGHLITWALDVHENQGSVVAECTAIMEGGHQSGRPLFGSRYCGENEELIISWSIDGSLCLWDSGSEGNTPLPIAILKRDPSYPIYSVEVSQKCIAVAGGDEGSFLGVPVYLYDVTKEAVTKRKVETPGIESIPENEDEDDSEECSDSTGDEQQLPLEGPKASIPGKKPRKDNMKDSTIS